MLKYFFYQITAYLVKLSTIASEKSTLKICIDIFVNQIFSFHEIWNLFQKKKLFFVDIKKAIIFALPIWEISSAGSEHLPYKQGVTGSNPVSPTKKAFKLEILKAFF